MPSSARSAPEAGLSGCRWPASCVGKLTGGAAGPEPALPLVASVSTAVAAGPEPALPLVASVSTPVAAGPEPALPLVAFHDP